MLQHKQLLWNVSYNIGMTCVTTQTVALNCFLQHWYDLCYNTNSCFEMFLATLEWLVLQPKQLLWIVSCNIGMTCVTTQKIGSELVLATLVWFVLQHKQLLWTVSCNIGDDLCYNTNSCFELFLATLVWLVLQHKQLVWIVSCTIGMTCITTQTVGLNCFLQHWYDLCYNTNSCFELFLATLVWLVLQHKQLLWNVSCNIGMTCVTTQTLGLTCFLQHWYDLCYNINSWSEIFLTTLVWLVLQHKQLLWNISCNIGKICVTTQTVALNCFLQHWYDLCYNTNSCFELFLATLVWLVLQHKRLLWNVSCNIGMTCVTTQTVGSELFFIRMVWLVLQHKQLGLNCFLQHWYDLCYNTNSCPELFLATLVWLVLQHKQLLWNVSCNIGMTCVTTQTVALKCFLQNWYDLCYNTNSGFELFLATLVWLVLQHKQLLWIVSCNIGMTCVTTQTVGSELFLATLVMICVTTQTVGSELFLATLVWLVLQHKQLLWTVSCNIGMTCVTTQTVALKCFLQHWYGLCYNTISCFEMILATLIWLVLQHKQLVWIISCNIGMICITTQTVALNCFLQHWDDLCYNTNSCFEMFLATLVWLVLQHKQCFELFLATLVWLVLQHKQLVWIVSYNIGMTCVTTQTVGLNCFLQHWYDLCYNTNSCSELFLTTLVWPVLQHKQ